MCEIECPYKGKCTSHPTKCGACSRNTGKRDYYRPRRRDWYTPYYPQWEYYPYWQVTISDGDNNQNWNTNTVTWNTSGSDDKTPQWTS